MRRTATGSGSEGEGTNGETDTDYSESGSGEDSEAGIALSELIKLARQQPQPLIYSPSPDAPHIHVPPGESMSNADKLFLTQHYSVAAALYRAVIQTNPINSTNTYRALCKLADCIYESAKNKKRLVFARLEDFPEISFSERDPELPDPKLLELLLYVKILRFKVEDKQTGCQDRQAIRVKAMALVNKLNLSNTPGKILFVQIEALEKIPFQEVAYFLLGDIVLKPNKSVEMKV